MQTSKSFPEHIAIILDGNRRYARKKGIILEEGHRRGAKNVQKLIEWALELSVKELTLYTFSTENFKRPEKELKYLMDNFLVNIRKLKKDKRIIEKSVRVRFGGRLAMFSKEIQEEMKEVMNITKNNNKLIVNFAMAYGGRLEVVDAVKRIIEKGLKKVDEEVIRKNLYLSDYPDLVIRPGGEKRVSNFLIWQSAYSEWYFTDKFWPEFTKKDLIEAIDDYKKRERRYGE
jgi:undecaprenyl diphosphate synthase